jgi:hypothetical protein
MQWSLPLAGPSDRVRSGRELAGQPISVPAMFGVLQNDSTSMTIDQAPGLDLLQGSKAAKTSQIVIQAAVPYTR